MKSNQLISLEQKSHPGEFTIHWECGICENDDQRNYQAFGYTANKPEMVVIDVIFAQVSITSI